MFFDKQKKSIRFYKQNGLVFIGIILVLASLYGSFIYSQQKSYKEIQLIYELQALRHAVVAYQYTTGQKPESFEDLIQGNFKDRNGNLKNYLPSKLRNQKLLRDPFGNPYVYDSHIAWVTSSTEEYINW